MSLPGSNIWGDTTREQTCFFEIGNRMRKRTLAFRLSLPTFLAEGRWKCDCTARRHCYSDGDGHCYSKSITHFDTVGAPAFRNHGATAKRRRRNGVSASAQVAAVQTPFGPERRERPCGDRSSASPWDSTNEDRSLRPATPIKRLRPVYRRDYYWVPSHPTLQEV
jgi:hypothetical protein